MCSTPHTDDLRFIINSVQRAGKLTFCSPFSFRVSTKPLLKLLKSDENCMTTRYVKC